jgi:hypothetical protein
MGTVTRPEKRRAGGIHRPGDRAQGESISVLVPVSERPAPLDEFYEEFSEPLRGAGIPFEFLFIVEPEHWGLVPPVERLREAGEPIRILRVGRTAGDTALLRVGAERANHDVFLTLPSYPRIEASSLPAIVEPVLAGTAMSVARRWPRRDSALNRLQNRVFHVLVGAATGGRAIRDVACGVRAIRRQVFESLPMYGDFHRFLPLFALRSGYEVKEVEAPQHAEDWQPRIYSPTVYLRRILDLFGLYFLMRFTEKPLRFFGLVGGGSFLAGCVILLVLAVERVQGDAMADRPMLLLGVLLMVLGVQAVALGLVGEIIVHVNSLRERDGRVVREPPGSTPHRANGSRSEPGETSPPVVRGSGGLGDPAPRSPCS